MTIKIPIAIVVDTLNIGGKELMVIQYLKKLDREKFLVYLVTLNHNGKLLPEAIKLADKYYSPRRLFPIDFISIIKLFFFFKKENIRIVHTNSWIESLYVLLSTITSGIVRIVTVHGIQDNWKFHLFIKIINKFDHVICVSRNVQLELSRFGLKNNSVSIIHNTFDEEKFFWDSKQIVDISTDTFRTVMVSSVHYPKDQLTAIKAVELLKNKGYRINIDFIGAVANEYLAECSDYVLKNKLSSCVKFFEPITINRNTLIKYKLFVMSSRYETFGIAPLEAMACGVPVLVSDIAALMDLIDHGKYGLFFKTGDWMDCAAMIEKCISDQRIIREFGSKGVERSKIYQPDIIIKQLENVYCSSVVNKD